ncbi:hypothetical protein L226DRAFT_222447 [Lentinus tigrinus ALCF2SS1-7]|uniref:Uncharacterized protein n=1 Tax=Lentinus tigrinus ALCF2SS1-6 TaxID=1328759 RepID=A0A5C2RWY3_9APHY|nr:hypothetical protein L227DRAFT_306537 [Lentinus tigrinus ALCF2SS1-6]RPD70641.1 hypothetical protein L226DRAFT_222447 [Lentinus tigrinus ALCF2SS1-7]
MHRRVMCSTVEVRTYTQADGDSDSRRSRIRTVNNKLRFVRVRHSPLARSIVPSPFPPLTRSTACRRARRIAYRRRTRRRHSDRVVVQDRRIAVSSSPESESQSPVYGVLPGQSSPAVRRLTVRRLPSVRHPCALHVQTFISAAKVPRVDRARAGGRASRLRVGRASVARVRPVRACANWGWRWGAGFGFGSGSGCDFVDGVLVLCVDANLDYLSWHWHLHLDVNAAGGARRGCARWP